ncbi:MAG: apolipoprotein N-acyltransferase, partial [Planctomycetes bacterium]|nr:apolipoprotein N-acyltransferase [Planctomycetota bacterium]
ERGDPEWIAGESAARRLIEAGTGDGRALLVQAYETDAEGRTRNSSILYQDGARADTYYKVELVPFGEYVPLGTVFPLLERMTRDIAGYVPDTVPGERARPVIARHGLHGGEETALGPLICFESVFPHLAIAQTRAGVEILVNQGNDEWFAGSAEPEQSLRIARLRAIECRRPCVRATNRGISGWIDAAGGVIGLVERDGRRTGTWAAGTLPVPLCRSVSLYALAGDWLPWASIACLIAALASGARRRLTARSPAPYDAAPVERRREDDGE